MSTSRCSSSSSLNAPCSSPNGSDEEDSDFGSSNSVNPGKPCLKDKRREAHTQAEQKRRDSIKKGYDELQRLVPTINNAGSTNKESKASTLQKGIDYIKDLKEDLRKEELELDLLQKQVTAMQIMQTKYETMLATSSQEKSNNETPLPDNIKFQVFTGFLDSLYQTYDPAYLRTSSFAEITSSSMEWLEDQCRPHILREIMSGVLQQYDDSTIDTSQQWS